MHFEEWQCGGTLLGKSQVRGLELARHSSLVTGHPSLLLEVRRAKSMWQAAGASFRLSTFNLRLSILA
jgi:hypothetical protein